MTAPRPADLCRSLLAALDASEGRRRRRKRDTTADAIGLEIKRALLDGTLQDDPDPEDFEGWLLARCLAADGTASVGAVRMMALEVDDMQTTVDYLKTKGVEIVWGPKVRATYARAEIRDPDGHPIELRQWF